MDTAIMTVDYRVGSRWRH